MSHVRRGGSDVPLQELEDMQNRHENGEAHYWALDRYPWEGRGNDRGNDGPPPAKRGRPRGSKNQPKIIKQEYHPLKHLPCPVCTEFVGTEFLVPCGHGMICVDCSVTSVADEKCFSCNVTVNESVTFRFHQS